MKLCFTAEYLKGTVELPASKSISNRLLIIQALSKIKFDIQNISSANDTALLQQILQNIQSNSLLTDIFVEDAGTPFRFLTALLCLQEGREFKLYGTERLMKRPILPLINALKTLGADIDIRHDQLNSYLHIRGKQLKGGELEIDAHISSQFISALCLIAPCIEDGLVIKLLNKSVSDSYIQMTLSIMHEFGIEYTYHNNIICIAAQAYDGKDYLVENDWSSATFFYAMAMMRQPCEIYLPGLFKNSMQGDADIISIGRDFGIETNFIKNAYVLHRSSSTLNQNTKYNLISTPDLAIPLIVACAFCYPNIQIVGIDHVELKESKRIYALQTELKKAGIELLYENEILSFKKISEIKLGSTLSFHTHYDHRIAMSLSLISLLGYEAELDDTECIRKSFPTFLKQIQGLGFEIK